MLFTHEGRLTRHIRAPEHQRQARASTEKLGRIRREKKGFDGPGSVAAPRRHSPRSGVSRGLPGARPAPMPPAGRKKEERRFKISTGATVRGEVRGGKMGWKMHVSLSPPRALRGFVHPGHCTKNAQVHNCTIAQLHKCEIPRHLDWMRELHFGCGAERASDSSCAMETPRACCCSSASCTPSARC